MKRGPIIAFIAIVVLLAGFFGSRAFKRHQSEQMAARLSAQHEADAARKAEEDKKRAQAEAEAHRLAEMKAKQDADESAAELARLQADQLAAEGRRRAAEDEAKQAAALRERLTKEKEASEGEARRIAEEREKDAIRAEEARKAALAQLAEVEKGKKEKTDREAFRLAALRRQQESEAHLAAQSEILARSIYPADYKRREHYYMSVDMENAERQRPSGSTAPATDSKTAPAK
jgi:hypothetical protein